jgi:MHS family proline/betaine transporter-like MFS transporter
VNAEPAFDGDRSAGRNRTAAPAHLRSVIACNVGVCLEGFDFIAFSAFSVLMAQLFFPSTDPLTRVLLAFASFGVAYVARPFGGVFWGLYADKRGRRPALAWIAILMAIGTATIALVPPYQAIGLAAPILVVAARLLQGFSAGGEFASATSLLVELAPANKRGLYASTQMATLIFSIALLSAVLLGVHAALPSEQLQSWGWRAVFGIGALIGPLGLYMRVKMAESPEFSRAAERRGATKHHPIREAFQTYRREMLCMAGLIVIGSASFYLVLVFMPIYATQRLGIPLRDAQISTIISALVQSVICLYAGALSDRRGRAAVLLPASLAYAALCYPLFAYLIAHPSFGALLTVQLAAGVVLGFVHGPMPVALSELLPARVRSTGIGIAYNTVGAIFGGLGPFLITLLVSTTGDSASPAYWALFTGLIGAAAVLGLRYALPHEVARSAHP